MIRITELFELERTCKYHLAEFGLRTKTQVAGLQILLKPICPKPSLCSETSKFQVLHDQLFGKGQSQKGVVFLQLYQSTASHSLQGKDYLWVVCLEGCTLSASSDPTRNLTFSLFAVGERRAEIKKGGCSPLERLWCRGWAAPKEKTSEKRSLGCVHEWIWSLHQGVLCGASPAPGQEVQELEHP